MAEKVTLNIFNPLCHTLSNKIQHDLDALLKEYESQFAKDKISTGTTPLTSMTVDTGNSDPVSQKLYSIAMKHYQWVKEEIKKLIAAKVTCSSRSSWSALIIVVPKGDGGKHLVIDYRALNKGHKEVYLAYAKGRGHILQAKWSHLFYNVRSLSRLPSYTIR